MGETEIIIEPGRQDIVFRRTFDAPREVVFRALTDPALIPSWWGPRMYETIVDVMEPRAGGRWRFLNRGADGQEFGFHGVYHEIEAPARVIQTTEFEGMPGHVGLETATLEEVGGKTLMTAVALFGSVEDRDMNVANGMEAGSRETYDRLDEVIQALLMPA
jgi:uncharacterized protein YndB with AHSA1/START domain